MPAAAQNIRFCHMYAAVYVCVTEEAEHTVARTMHTPKKKVPKVKERSRHSANNNPASTLWCHFMTCPHLGQQARSPSPMIVFVQGQSAYHSKLFKRFKEWWMLPLAENLNSMLDFCLCRSAEGGPFKTLPNDIKCQSRLSHSLMLCVWVCVCIILVCV